MNTFETLRAMFAGKSLVTASTLQGDEVRDFVLENMPAGTTLPWTTFVLVEFDQRWYNGTGYMDHAVHAQMPEVERPEKTSFEQLCYITADTANRLLLIYPTEVGNIVMFQRYSSNKDVWVSNNPSELEPMMSTQLNVGTINMVTHGVIQSVVDKLVYSVVTSVNYQHLATEEQKDNEPVRRTLRTLREREDYKQFIPTRKLVEEGRRVLAE